MCAKCISRPNDRNLPNGHGFRGATAGLSVRRVKGATHAPEHQVGCRAAEEFRDIGEPGTDFLHVPAARMQSQAR